MGHHRPPYVGPRLIQAAADIHPSVKPSSAHVARLGTAADAIHSAPIEAPRTKTVLLLSEARSGSTWIAELLAYHLEEQHGIMLFGLAGEHFAEVQWHTSSQHVRDRLDSLYIDSRGFRGTKIFCPAMSVVCMLGQKDPDLLQSFFGPDTVWIVVRRRDRIAQAVSLAHAWTDDRFHVYTDDGGSETTRVAPATVSEALSAIMLSDVYLEAMTQKIAGDRQLVVYYEDVIEDHAGFLAAALSLLGISVPTDPAAFRDSTKVKKLGTATKRRDQQEFVEWLLRNHHHEPLDSQAGSAPAQGSPI